MIELLALAVTEVAHRLWSRKGLPWRAAAVSLYVAYALTVPPVLHWAEEVLPEAVNMALPFAGIAAATATGIAHYRHHRAHAHAAAHAVAAA